MPVAWLTLWGRFPSPVSWKCIAEKKTAAGIYVVRVTAAIDPGWHIYSRHMNPCCLMPTRVSFRPHPDIVLRGSVLECGELQTRYDEILLMETRYYQGLVTFVQAAVLKGEPPATLSGTVEFMACEAKACMPPRTERFEVTLE